jgi:peptidoglycan/LPS O-acetylase OafA/YrhL
MRNNSFDLLRLVAACSVLLSHCFALSGQGALEPAVRYTRYGSLGEIAVDVFFVISGYLITGSYLRSRNLVDYVGKRALRLLPALWCAVLLATLLVGPVVTQLPLTEYLAHSQTRAYLGNLYLNINYLLPGVFASNPYPNAVNGSLWTLPSEVLMYLLVMVLGMMRQLNRTACLATLLLFVCLYFAVPGSRVPYPKFLMTLLPYYETTRLGIFFFAGASLVFARQEWMTKRYLAVGVSLLLVLLANTFLAPIWLMLLLPYVVIALAQTHSEVSAAVSRAGDFSYGVYVYAFPVQQMAAMLLGSKVSALSLFILSMPVTLLVASASWYLVEKPSLQLKSRLSPKGASVAPHRAAPQVGA